jgi:microcystin-dependent protein
MSRNYKSIAEPKTLNGNVTNVATQITLSNVTGLPSPPYVLVLSPDTANEEAVLVTVDQAGVTAPTVKIERAIETGATAQTHTNGNTVRHMIVGSDLQLVHDHLDNTTTAHGVAGAVVGTTSTQTLTNKTLTTPKINENVTVTATSTELNVLDGITASTAELNIMDGVTSTAAELNILDGATLTTTELNYVDGVTSAVQTQINTASTAISTNTPAGVVNMWVANDAPTGWFLCDGTAKSRTTYSALFAVIGTTYGSGDNTTTFNLPDLRGRAPIGAGLGRNVANNADLATSRTLGQRVSDAQTVTLTEAQMPVHTHVQNSHNHLQNEHNHFIDVNGTTLGWTGVGNGGSAGAPTNVVGDGYFGNYVRASNITATNQAQTATNQNAGGTAGVTQAHENTQPSTVINFIIKF